MGAGGRFGENCHRGPSPLFEMSHDHRVQRDIFPLPSAELAKKVIRPGLSRSCQRRLLRSEALEREVQNTALALNCLYGGQDILVQQSSYSSSSQMSSAQTKVFEFIRSSLHDLGPIPEDLSGPGALSMLRASGEYGSDSQTPASLGSYDPGKLSLPLEGNVPVPLEDLWGNNGQQFVGTFIHSVSLPEIEAQANIRASGVRKCYSDPLLRHPKTFSALVKRLHGCGLVSYTHSKPLANVELFFVRKKSGQLRMVVDCRHSNCWFRPPLGVALATGDALGRIELGENEKLCFASADLKDAFYHLQLPLALRSLFGLRAVRACDVGVSEVEGRPVGWNEMIHPVLAAVPMGWSWALWLCQTLHEKLVLKAGANDSNRLADKKPVPEGNVLHTEYVDNFHVIGTNHAAVKVLSQSGITALRNAGLIVHEEEESIGSATILGWEFSADGKFRPTRHRLWKVRLAIQEILRVGSISGRQLERAVGHMSFICMGRREGLAVLGDVYSFIRRFYNHPHKIWKGVRNELAIWYAISPLLWRDLRSQWSETVYATDASEWGLGATTSRIPADQVKDLGKFSERWRFGDPEFAQARRSHLVDLGGVGEDGVADNFKSNEQATQTDPFIDRSRPVLRNVDFGVVDRPWTVVGRYKWKRQQSIPILEARAALYAVKHITRSVSGFGRRHLILSDSMTAISGISKGRSTARGLRRVIQQIAAVCLCSRISVHVRWIPSEWNPADGPSRLWQLSSVSKFAEGWSSTGF